MSADTPAPVPLSDRHAAVRRSDESTGLREALRGCVFPMTVAFFLWYALHVILSAYARGFMDTTLVGNIDVAIAFGLTQMTCTFVIVWLYTRYADSKLDPVADRLLAELERHLATDEQDGDGSAEVEGRTLTDAGAR